MVSSSDLGEETDSYFTSGGKHFTEIFIVNRNYTNSKYAVEMLLSNFNTFNCVLYNENHGHANCATYLKISVH